MIVLERVTKIVVNDGKRRKVLSSVSMTIPTDRRIALLGTSPEDNKTLIDILAGKSLPNSGRVIRKARVSYPVGDVSGFDVDMTVRSNVAYVARLYGADVKSTVAFVERMARLGPAFGKRYRDLTGSEKTELGRILTYSIPFDLYLLNREVTGDKGPQSASFALLEARIAQSAGIIAAADKPQFVRRRCEMGLVLHDGALMAFADIEQALSVMRFLREKKYASN